MKKITILLLAFNAIAVCAQNDTMYIMKGGVAVERISYNAADIDSIIFYNPMYPKGYFIDNRDGTLYRTVEIGAQVWMAENLRYLPQVNKVNEYSYNEPRYYVYNYNGNDLQSALEEETYKIYGVLYNWPAVMAGAAASDANPSGVQGVCPAGWHVPSDAEFKQLADELGGEDVAGGKIKATGTTFWNAPNYKATNDSGFSALGSGELQKQDDVTYRFYGLKTFGIWWCTKEANETTAINWGTFWNISKLYNNTPHTPGVPKSMGFPIRCLKD